MPRPSRREFALATAAALQLLGGPAPAAAPPPAAGEAEALRVLLRARFGKHLSREQFERLLGRVRAAQAAGERLARFKLTNADEPDFVFSADLP